MNEHWLRAIRYNTFCSFLTKNISASIPAMLSSKALLGFYYVLDFCNWFNNDEKGSNGILIESVNGEWYICVNTITIWF